MVHPSADYNQTICLCSITSGREWQEASPALPLLRPFLPGSAVLFQTVLSVFLRLSQRDGKEGFTTGFQIMHFRGTLMSKSGPEQT